MIHVALDLCLYVIASGIDAARNLVQTLNRVLRILAKWTCMICSLANLLGHLQLDHGLANGLMAMISMLQHQTIGTCELQVRNGI